MLQYPKRLIEVDLPIKRISAHARREKSIRHGHISTLHIWWARRPLAACRAVVCASLWPDPADELCPQEFRKRATEIITAFIQKTDSPYFTGKVSPESEGRWRGILKSEVPLDAANPKHWNVLRTALLDFIADFANWDNSTHEDFLEASRALTQAAHEALGGEPGTRPLVVDPFAGGGSIPLEALRVGADAFASDLNPVAVLLNKVVLEYIPKYGQRLADEVLEWSQWVKKEAEKELVEFYPKDPDGSTPIAYLWARTILSESPELNAIPVEVPLLRSLWLSKRKGFKRALRWTKTENGELKTTIKNRINLDGKSVQVRQPELEIFEPGTDDEVEDGTVKGGAATCPLTNFTTPAKNVKKQLSSQKGGALFSRLYAVYIERDGSREFRLSNSQDLESIEKTNLIIENLISSDSAFFPTELINPTRPYKNTRGLSAVTRIGCETFGDLYTRRQAFSIKVFFDAVNRILLQQNKVDEGLVLATKTLLNLAASKAISQNTSVSRWDPTRLTIKGVFSKQALAVVWDFAEANPFSGGSAGWDVSVNWLLYFIGSNQNVDSIGQVIQGSATDDFLPADFVSAFITDPPYFAAIPYADLSDFFYVWLKRALHSDYPDLFKSDLTDKGKELIVTNAQVSETGKPKNEDYFRDGMTLALQNARLATMPDSIGVVIYAEATAVGWEAILAAIISAGWIVTASWPIDTEMASRTRAKGAASLQSSVHIVCRPRENPDGSLREEVGDWRDVLQELPLRIHQWMPRLAQEGVVGADAIFACLGPALEIFSRYSSVEKASGEEVTLREYLEYVWGAVSKEALGMIFDDADTIDFEEDARLTAIWFWVLKAANQDANNSQKTETPEEEPVDDNSESQDTKSKKSKSGYSMEYDAVRKLAQGLGADLQKLSRPGGIVIIKGNLATLNNVNLRESYLLGQQLSLFGDSKEIRSKGKRKSSQNPTVKLKDLDARQLSLLPQDSQYASNDDDSPLIPGLLPDQKAVPLLEQLLSNGSTTLDRLHQAMLLFGRAQTPLLKPFLEKCGMGDDPRFWKLAQALSALYPNGTDEKRWVDGVLARKKGLGF